MSECNRLFPALNASTQTVSGCLKTQEFELHKLFANLHAAHPQADDVYWAARTWQLWLWQPAYVAVWVAARGFAVDLRGGAHETAAAFTDSFRLPEQILHHHTPKQAIELAWQNLQIWTAEQFALCAPHWQISEKLAHYFVYDGILKALAAAHRFGWQTRAEVEYGERVWRETIAARCFGELLWVGDTFQVNMLACCQHYRRDSDTMMCDTCPKNRRLDCGCG